MRNKFKKKSSREGWRGLGGLRYSKQTIKEHLPQKWHKAGVTGHVS